MRRFLLTLLVLFVVSPTWAQKPDAPNAIGNAFVRCDSGQSLGRALRLRSFFPRVQIRFTGACDEVLVIDRDHVTLRGVGEDPRVLGRVEVTGAANVTLEGFEVLGEIDDPFDTSLGAINILKGSAVTVRNVHVQTQNVRGVRVIAATAALEDVSVDDGILGAFVFRAANLTFAGNIVATRSSFGASFIGSQGVARLADFTFDQNFFSGLILQGGSFLEHVEGRLLAQGAPFGVLIAGQSIYGYGGTIEARENSSAGIFLDEVAGISPLVGAPGGGPRIVVEDNPEVGIALERYSTLDTLDASILGNGQGLTVDNSSVRLAATTIRDNAVDVSLTFDAKLTLTGEENDIGQPLVCDDTVLVRGPLTCGGVAAEATGGRFESATEWLRQELSGATYEPTMIERRQR